MDIVITGLQSYDNDIGCNSINLAHEFAKNHRVLYVNYALDRLTLYREPKNPKVLFRKKIIRGEAENLIKVADNLWTLYPKTVLESIGQLPVNFLFDFLNKINNKRFARQISIAMQTLGFSDIILFTDNDMFRSFYLKELLKPNLFIYYSRDYMIGADWWKRHGIRIEAELIRKADLAVANSVYLTNYLKKFNSCSYYIGQGCDVSAFDRKLITSVPDDIRNMPKPIIGYIGALFTSRLDIDIIHLLATKHPEWSVVLVGPEDDGFKGSKLHQVKNIHFLGSRNPSALPSYLYAFDVAINPQILNEVTIGNYPRKIDEYLAMGKPIVATKTEAMEVFEGYTYLASTAGEYLKLTELALVEDNEDLASQRENFARSHTWEANVKAIFEAIECMKRDKSPKTGNNDNR